MKYALYGLVLGGVAGSFIGIPIPLALAFAFLGGIMSSEAGDMKQKNPDLALYLESPTGEAGGEVIVALLLLGVAALFLFL